MAVKLRKDLEGVVFLDGRPYRAGETVPDGVRVGAHVSADGKDHGVPDAPAVQGEQVDALTDVEQTRAVELGIPTEDVHPERVRGALVGYEQGRADVLLQAATASDFDPAEETVEGVEGHLVEHPEDLVSVLVLEARGQARKGILDAYR
jgi:hypothetical protein